MQQEALLEHLGNIVAAHVSNNVVSVNDLPGLILSVHATLVGLGGQPMPIVEERKPAVPVRSSIKPDALICLECGFKSKSLKRHIGSAHNLTPDGYRERWALARSYPMVAPDYSAMRKELAVKNRLGRKSEKTPSAVPPAASSS